MVERIFSPQNRGHVGVSQIDYRDTISHAACVDIDQNPRRLGELQLVQGIANMAQNGPDDGGLVVVEGSPYLHEQYFDSIGGFKTSQDQGEHRNGYKFTMEDLQWYLDHGAKVVKVCAGVGDLIRERQCRSTQLRSV